MCKCNNNNCNCNQNITINKEINISNDVDGHGIPDGGTSGQILSKIDNTDYNVEWVDNSGGGGGEVTSGNGISVEGTSINLGNQPLTRETDISGPYPVIIDTYNDDISQFAFLELRPDLGSASMGYSNNINTPIINDNNAQVKATSDKIFIGIVTSSNITPQKLEFSANINPATFNPIVLTDPLSKGITLNWSDDSSIPSNGYIPKRYTDSNFLKLIGGTVTGDVQQTTSPVNANSLITKGYVDNQVAGLIFKKEVLVASTGNVNIVSAPSSIDGITLTNGDRVLLKNQTNAAENGIRIFTATSAALNRSTDADTGIELANKTIPVLQGTTNHDTWWIVTNDNITIDVTNLVLSQVGGAGGSYTNGTGLSLTGNIFALDLAYTDGRYPLLSGSYSNPSWINSLAYSKLTGSPVNVSAFTNDSGYITSSALGINPSSSVYVETTGNDSTAVVGSRTKAFLTIDAALIALPSTGGIIYVGIGTFNSPSNANLKDNISIIGSGKPKPNWTITNVDLVTNRKITNYTSPTALVGGTILLGTFNGSFYNNIRLENFGVDVGSAWCTAFNSNNPADGIFFAQQYNLGGGLPSQDGLHQIQPNYAQRYGIVIKNVASLCQNSTAAVHACLVENAINPHLTDISTYFSLYGVVMKSIGGELKGLDAHGHGYAGLTLKTNDYAYGWGINVSNVYITSIATFDGGGLWIMSDNAGYPLQFPKVNNITIEHTLYGIKNQGTVDGFKLSNATIFNTSGYGIQLDSSCVFYSLTNIVQRYSATVGIILTGGASAQTNHLSNIECSLNTTGGISIVGSSTNYFLNNFTMFTNTGYGYSISGNVYGQNVKSIGNGTDVGTFANLALGETLLSILTRNPTSSAVINITDDNSTFGLAVEKLSLAGTGLAFNRNTKTGATFDATKYSFQLQHTGTGTATTDNIAWQVRNGAGTVTAALSLVINGAGYVGIGSNSTNSFFKLPAGITTASSMQLTTGVAPTTPISGDIWRSAAGVINFYDGSATKVFAFSSDISIGGTYSTSATTQSTFTIPIGITLSNTTYKVTASADNLLSAVAFYINNKTTTTFDIVVLSPLTGTVSFDWVLVK